MEGQARSPGKVTTYSYGDSGQLLGKVEPGGLATTFAYDDGRLASTTLPDATTTSFTYDLAGNALTADRSATTGVDVTYVYDLLNRATSVVDATGTSSFTYDSRGNLLAEVDGSGDSIGYDYDSLGLLETITYPGSNDVDYEYDAVGQMTSVTDWLDNETTFTWTADGQLDTQTSGNGVVQSRDYNSRGHLTDTDVEGLTTSLASFSYGYDAAGQLTTSDTALDGQDVGRAFEYDPLSQLANVATTVGATTTSEDFDATSGGLLTEIVGGRELTYNTAQQLVSIDAIVGPDIDFTYDTAGRRTTSTSTTYGYDAAGYLATVTTPTATVDYTTDARGLRQTRTEGTATDDFLWSTIGELPLLLDDGDHKYVYGPSLTPIAQINGSTVEYLHTDNLGSVRLITDNTGDAIATNTFDEFGNRVNHTGTADSAFGYTGAWTDADTGLVHLRARDYDPATGQFLTVDPAVDQTRQPYAYVGNNPLSRTDPTGLDWLQDTGDWLAGWADSLTLGGTKELRKFMGVDDAIDPCSDFYIWGGVGGTLTSYLIPGIAVVKAGQLLLRLASSVVSRVNNIHSVAASVRTSIETVQFGRNANQIQHAIRHILETGDDAAEVVAGSVTSAIRSDIAPKLASLSDELYKGMVLVGSQNYAYHAKRLADGIVNIGRITLEL